MADQLTKESTQIKDVQVGSNTLKQWTNSKDDEGNEQGWLSTFPITDGTGRESSEKGSQGQDGDAEGSLSSREGVAGLKVEKRGAGRST